MAKGKQKETPKGFENVEETLTRTEQFLEDNYKPLLYGLAVVVVIVGAFWLMKVRRNSATEEAHSQMWVAEDYFSKDSLDLALFGDGNYLGFIDISEEYKSTRPGNLANYYAGVCFLRRGDFEDAIEYLNKYKKKDISVSPVALTCTGDAYVELGDTETGIDYYLQAADFTENSFYNPIALLKAGQLYELDGDFENALKQYQRIQDNYPESTEGRNIEKYIARVKISN
jgi:pentatricopeptide repeat protein